MKIRKVIEQLSARPSSDGDGVKLLRVFGGAQPERFDPFLLLDEFGSDQASDYIGGFPPHPHRGFQTITYMLQGKMEHRDHMNNIGLLNDGDVQWMTAGRGVIHSEMPKQTQGKMRGFQLWLNLPAKNKMQTANYEDVNANKIPEFDIAGSKIKAIAGQTSINKKQIKGYFDVEDTRPLYLDIHIEPGDKLNIQTQNEHNVLIYVYQETIQIGEDKTLAKAQTISRLEKHGDVLIQSYADKPAKVIVLSGKPIEEPIVQYGPFVMNSQQEIEQALQDYRKGILT